MAIALKLKIDFGNDKTKEISSTLNENKKYLIGRKGSWIKLSDEQLSRIHCYMTVKGSVLTLIDNKSTNKTYLNKEAIKKKELTEGDIITIGNTTIQVLGITFNEEVKNDVIDQEEEELEDIEVLEEDDDDDDDEEDDTKTQSKKTKVKSTRSKKTSQEGSDLQVYLGIPIKMSNIIQLYKDFFKSPLKVFQKIDYSLPLKQSLIIIGVTTLIGDFMVAVSNPLESMTSAIFSSIMGVFVTVVMMLYWAYSYNVTKKITKINGSTKHFLDFYAHMTILMLPIEFATAISFTILPIFLALFMVMGLRFWFFICFIKAFKPKPLVAFVITVVNAFILLLVISVISTPKQSSLLKNMRKDLKHQQVIMQKEIKSKELKKKN
ncbi:MAG: FHA domain-containing protein [Bacteriovoracaceae bacterium]|nr:FHA domain-containing protein [Bacteriovoracaceae bacterium]